MLCFGGLQRYDDAAPETPTERAGRAEKTQFSTKVMKGTKDEQARSRFSGADS